MMLNFIDGPGTGFSNPKRRRTGLHTILIYLICKCAYYALVDQIVCSFHMRIALHHQEKEIFILRGMFRIWMDG